MRLQTPSLHFALVLCSLLLVVCTAEMSGSAQQDVGWGDAAFVTTVAIAAVIVLVGITFFVIMILASMRYRTSSLLCSIATWCSGFHKLFAYVLLCIPCAAWQRFKWFRNSSGTSCETPFPV